MTGQRHAMIEIRGGPSGFRRVVVPAGGNVRVGRTSLADFVVAHDEQMSQVHWELSWDGARCQVRDLSSATGTLAGGQRIEQAEVRSGAWIRAGQTDFLVYFEREGLAAEAPDEVASAPGANGSLRFFNEIAGRKSLFALLDSARSERVIPLLQTAVDEYTSLYEGIQAETMADSAPYLVRFGEGSRLLARLVREGWGDHWGIYGESAASLRELRSHFRRLLYVTREKDGLPMYFRFYDPRVLGAFLPICTVRQAEGLFGPVERFFAEAPPGAELRRFECADGGKIECHVESLTAGAPLLHGLSVDDALG